MLKEPKREIGNGMDILRILGVISGLEMQVTTHCRRKGSATRLQTASASTQHRPTLRVSEHSDGDKDI